MLTWLVVVHLLAAAVWVGGTVALVFATVPVLRRLPAEQRADSVRALGRRWKPIGWTALAVLGATGIWLAFGYWGADDPDVLFDTDRVTSSSRRPCCTSCSSRPPPSMTSCSARASTVRSARVGRARCCARCRSSGWISFAATLALPILGVLLTT